MASSVTSAAGAITFSGSSTFSSSFQQVLQRAVAIASMPLQAMQNSVATFQGQQSALTTLQSGFSVLQNDIQSISTAATGSMTASVSDGTVVSATASSSALPGTYSIEVDDMGSSTTTISNANLPVVSDPTTTSISTASSYTLTIDGTAHTITPAGGSLEDLASAINSAGVGAQATIVNLGSNTSPNYRLSVTSTNLGADTIQLNAGATSLLTTLSTGADAQYKVNGNSTKIQSTSSLVTLAPGLTVNLLESAPGQPVTITVAANFDSLSGALSTFATDYNSASQAIRQNIGQNGGALSGESIVYSLSQVLNQVAQFTGASGSVRSLSDLGLSLDSTGQLSFDASQFSSSNPTDVQSFLGGITSGGFLQAANNAISGVADPNTGALATEFNTLASEVTNENSQISDEQARINDLQTSLTAQLTAADASIAVLEQQKTYYANLFAAEYLNNNPSGANG
jgi:flagellar hook-associated protein 2